MLVLMHVWNDRKPTTGLRLQLVTISGNNHLSYPEKSCRSQCSNVAISAPLAEAPWVTLVPVCRCSGGSPVECWQSTKHPGSSDRGRRWVFPPSSLVFYLDSYAWIDNSPDLKRALYILLVGWLFRSLTLWLLFGVLRPCSEVSGKENSTSCEHPAMLT